MLSEFKDGIHKFINKTVSYFVRCSYSLPLPPLFKLWFHLTQDCLLYLSVQDPHSPPREGYNEHNNVSIWTKLGRNKVTVADYLKLVEAFRPNVFECLCDSVSSAGCKLKRIRKSVDRSLNFLDQTISDRENNEVTLIHNK